MREIALAAASLALACSPAAAQPSAPADLFATVDLNGDGRIAPIEFHLAREEMFRRIDDNGDGRLTLPEVRTLAGDGKRRASPSLERIRRVRAADANHDGALDPGEFRLQGEARFKAADRDGDGVLNKTEAAALVGALGGG